MLGVKRVTRPPPPPPLLTSRPVLDGKFDLFMNLGVKSRIKTHKLKYCLPNIVLINEEFPKV